MDGLIEGRIVHYVNQLGIHMAAVVTYVHSPAIGRVNLFAFLAGRSTADEGCLKLSVNYDELMAKGTWHWIEKA